jgi:hypothetical protein
MATAIDDVTANPTSYGDMVSKCDDGFSGDVFLWLTEDDFRDFVFDSPASLIAQQILGQERINFFYDQLFVKQPGCYIRPELPRKDMGLPGYWAVLFVRAVMQHPAGHDLSSPLLLFEKICGENTIAFAKNRTLDIRDEYNFRGHLPTAHTLVCLRFADLVTETVARLTTGSGGLTPRRAGFAPAGRRTKFQGDIAVPPIPIDQQGLVALIRLPSNNPVSNLHRLQLESLGVL